MSQYDTDAFGSMFYQIYSMFCENTYLYIWCWILKKTTYCQNIIISIWNIVSQTLQGAVAKKKLLETHHKFKSYEILFARDLFVSSQNVL